MRLLVASDTHGDCKNLSQVLSLLGSSMQALIHLGDGSKDPQTAMRTSGIVLPVYGVRGNCDYDSSVPLARQFDAAGFPIMMAHGHRYPIGENTSCLVYAAREASAKAFFFGHSHIPECEQRGGVYIVNPGSLSRPRGPWGPSFAVIETSPSYIDVKIYELLTNLSIRAIRL